MTLGEKIKNIRNQKELSQEKLAELLNVSRQAVSKWETDLSKPDTQNLICLSEIFNVSIDELTEHQHISKTNAQKKAVQNIPKVIIYIFIGILIISLLGNFHFRLELSNYQKRTTSVMGNNYSSFFNTLNVYHNRLEYIMDYETNHNNIEIEIKSLEEDVNALINYARSYGLLNPEPNELLPSLIWDIATSSRWVYEEYLTKADIIRNNGDKIHEFSKIIDEILTLENSTRIKMTNSNKGFIGKVMSDTLYPKTIEVTQLTILSK